MTAKFYLSLALSFLLISLNCAAAPLVEGQHYQKLPPSISQSSVATKLLQKAPGKTQVIEFFGYGCYACSLLHPYVDTYRDSKPHNVEVLRVPVVFHRGWDVLAKAFYTAEVLGRSHQMDPAFFEALLKHHQNLTLIPTLQKFFERFDVEGPQFETVFYSFEVERRANFAKELTRAFGIMATPSLIVLGPKGAIYTDVIMAGNEKALIANLPELIKRVN